MGDHHQSNRQLPLFANRVEYLSIENPFDAHFVLFIFFNFLMLYYALQSSGKCFTCSVVLHDDNKDLNHETLLYGGDLQQL